MTGKQMGQSPHTDAEWARQVEQRLRALENPSQQRVGSVVLAEDAIGSLFAHSPGAKPTPLAGPEAVAAAAAAATGAATIAANAATSQMRGWLTTLMADAQSIWAAILGATGQNRKGFPGWFGELWSALIDALNAIVTGFQTLLHLIRDIPGPFTAVWTLIKGAVSGFNQLWEDVSHHPIHLFFNPTTSPPSSDLVVFIKGVVTGGEAFAATISQIPEDVLAALSSVFTFVQTSHESVKQVLDALGLNLLGDLNTEPWAAAVFAAVKTFVAWLKSLLDKFVDAIQGGLSALLIAFISAIHDAIKAFRDAVHGLPIVTALKTFGHAIADAFYTLRTDVAAHPVHLIYNKDTTPHTGQLVVFFQACLSAGTAFVAGIGSEITDSVGVFIQAAMKLISDVWAAVVVLLSGLELTVPTLDNTTWGTSLLNNIHIWVSRLVNIITSSISAIEGSLGVVLSTFLFDVIAANHDFWQAIATSPLVAAFIALLKNIKASLDWLWDDVGGTGSGGIPGIDFHPIRFLKDLVALPGALDNSAASPPVPDGGFFWQLLAEGRTFNAAITITSVEAEVTAIVTAIVNWVKGIHDALYHLIHSLELPYLNEWGNAPAWITEIAAKAMAFADWLSRTINKIINGITHSIGYLLITFLTDFATANHTFWQAIATSPLVAAFITLLKNVKASVDWLWDSVTAHPIRLLKYLADPPDHLDNSAASPPVPDGGFFWQLIAEGHTFLSAITITSVTAEVHDIVNDVVQWVKDIHDALYDLLHGLELDFLNVWGNTPAWLTEIAAKVEAFGAWLYATIGKVINGIVKSLGYLLFTFFTDIAQANHAFWVAIAASPIVAAFITCIKSIITALKAMASDVTAHPFHLLYDRTATPPSSQLLIFLHACLDAGHTFLASITVGSVEAELTAVATDVVTWVKAIHDALYDLLSGLELDFLNEWTNAPAWVTNIVGWFTGFGSGLFNTLTAIISAIGGSIGMLAIKFIEALVIATKNWLTATRATPVFSALHTFRLAVKTAFSTLYTDVVTNGHPIHLLVDPTRSPPTGDLVVCFNAVVAAGTALVTAVTTSVPAEIDTLIAAAVAYAQAIHDAIKALVTGMDRTWSDWNFSTWGTSIRGKINGVFSWLNSLFGTTIGALGGSFGTLLLSFATGLITTVRTFVDNFLQTVIHAVSTLVKNLVGRLTTFRSQITSDPLGIFTYFGTAVSGANTDVGSYAAATTGLSGSAVVTLVTGVVSGFNAMLTGLEIANVPSPDMTNLASIVNSWLAGTWLSNMFSSLSTAISGGGRWGYVLSHLSLAGLDAFIDLINGWAGTLANWGTIFVNAVNAFLAPIGLTIAEIQAWIIRIHTDWDNFINGLGLGDLPTGADVAAWFAARMANLTAEGKLAYQYLDGVADDILDFLENGTLTWEHILDDAGVAISDRVTAIEDWINTTVISFINTYIVNTANTLVDELKDLGLAFGLPRDPFNNVTSPGLG